MSFSKRPANSKPRPADALIKGHENKVEFFLQELSQFKNKDGSVPKKLIAFYKDFGYLFYTYLSKDFDDKEEEYVNQLNERIKNNENVRLVFYGKISSNNEFEILTKDEKVNQEKLEGIRLIEAAASPPITPTKRHSDSERDSEGSLKRFKST